MRTRTVNEKLVDRYTAHAVMLERLKKAEAIKMVRFLKKDVYPNAMKRMTSVMKKVELGSITDVNRIKRVKEQLIAIDRLTKAAMKRAYGKSVDSMVDVAGYEARWNAKTIESVMPVDIDFNMPDVNVLKSIVTTTPIEGKKLSQWFSGYSKSVRKDLTKKVNIGLALGESNQVIGRRIRESLNMSAKKASYLARTVTSATVHNAREEVFKQNSDIIKSVQFVATLDTRTTLTCIGLDGKRFPIGEGPRPPVHFNCRSTVIPVTVSWKEFGLKDPKPSIRSSMDGKPVSAKTTYGQWLKRQSKVTQETVLGKKRAELFRSGGFTVEQFIDNDYNAIPLRDLGIAEGVPLMGPPTGTVAMSSAPDRVIRTMDDSGNLDSWENYYWKHRGGKSDKHIRYDFLKQQDSSTLKPKQVLLTEKRHEIWGDGVHRSLKPFESKDVWSQSLSLDEKKSIDFWKEGSYNLRRFQLGELNKGHTNFGDVQWGGMHLSNSLSRAGNYKGTVFRGTGEFDEILGMKKGKVITLNANYSTSKSKKVADMFRKEAGKNAYLFEMRVNSAVDLENVGTRFISQKEVVTRIGSQYKVISMKKMGDFTYVVLDEVTPTKATKVTMAAPLPTARRMGMEAFSRVEQLRKVYDDLDSGIIDLMEAKKGVKKHLSFLRKKFGINNTEAKAYVFGELPIMIHGQEGIHWMPKRIKPKVTPKVLPIPKIKPGKKPKAGKTYYGEVEGWNARHQAYKKELIGQLGYDPSAMKNIPDYRKHESDFWEKMVGGRKRNKLFTKKDWKVYGHRASVTQKGYVVNGVERYNNTLEHLVSKDSPVVKRLKETGLNVHMSLEEGRRASCSFNSITITKTSSMRSLHHELGHTLELDNKIKDKAFLWLKKRSKGAVGKAKDVLGFDGDEPTYINEFFEKYVGKTYVWRNEEYGTEVLSMGMQNFESSYTLFQFAIKDFDHFAFMHGVLTGAI